MAKIMRTLALNPILARMFRVIRRSRVITRVFRVIYLIFSNQVWQQKKHFGESNPDVTFYVIRPPIEDFGIINLAYLNNVHHLRYAINKGYIPVVDFLHYRTLYSDSELNKNVWEHYFTQPSDYTLDEVYQSKNVVLSNKYYRGYPSFEDSTNNSWILEYGNIIKQFIRFNSKTQKFIDIQKDELIKPEDTVLGVFCRGTDYIKLKPAGHYVQPSFCELLEEITKFLENHTCNKILLTTEDGHAVEMFKNQFGSALVVPKQNFVDNYDDKKGMLIEEYRQVSLSADKYVSGLEYLNSVYLLSQCQYFVGALAAGSIAALMLNQGRYIDKRVIFKGYY